MKIVEPWPCPTCNITVKSAYCPNCGEQPVRAAEMTLRSLIGQVAEALSNVDSRLIRSFRCLVNRPGALTAAYLAGQRQLYIKPFQLFLIANAAFFAAQSLTENRIFSTTLASHLHRQDWSSYAQELVARRLVALGTTMERYAPVFDQAVALNSKSLIILMVLPFSLALAAVFHRSRLPYAAHLVFSLHLYAFLLLLFCAGLAVASIHMLFGGTGLESNMMDNVLSIINVVACAAYLYLAIGPIYGVAGRKQRLLKTVLLTVVVACLVLGYRFILLPITLYTTG